MADVSELALDLQIKINSELLQRLEGLENLIEASKSLLYFREGIIAKEYDKFSPTLAGALHDLAMAVKAAEQKMHPTFGESAASVSESKPAPKRVI